MMQGEELKELMKKKFCESYLEPLYYFCLKKTGDSLEAEDLSGDIALNIFEALEKGTVPQHFSAWVWQIARNRYSTWADRKRRRNESVSGADGDELEIADDYSIEGDYIHREELSQLRRELAFISSEYRDIVVAYYIEDKKARDIAKELGIPEGTVKTRLFRARNILKEGMNMAREFGIKSYKPEDVNFVASGELQVNRPWGLIQRRIPKNILLEASNNPSTVEELAVELGIAVPYMEEEVAVLEEGTLLKKLEGGKYITNFYIMDKDTQRRVMDAIEEKRVERAILINKICCEIIGKVRETFYIPTCLTDNDLKWWLSLRVSDIAESNIDKCDKSIPKRENGEKWSLSGYEVDDSQQDGFVGMNGSGGCKIKAQFWSYKIRRFGLWERAGEMEAREVGLLVDLFKSGRGLDTLTESENSIWESMNGRFAHVEDGKAVSDVAIIQAKELRSMIESHRDFKSLVNNVTELYDTIVNMLKQSSNAVLHENISYNATTELFKLRMTTLVDLVNRGDITVPENADRSTMGMWIEV